MKDQIKTSIAALESNGFSGPAKNLKCIEIQLDDDQYKVAFVGEFKTGKSTLINRIFLGQALLFTDIEEATAVPTELVWGAEPRMEVYNYRKRIIDLEMEEATAVSVTEGLEEPLIFPNPSTDDIKKYTAGDSASSKEELARTTSHVRVVTPKDNLKGFSLTDTPGVNSGTEAVLSTVFRVLPQSDLIIFVKKPSQFTQAELEFLTSKAFEQTGTRGMILVNEDPRFSTLSEEQRSALKKSMEAQLRNIGRIQMPIEWVHVPFDHKNGAEIKQAPAINLDGENKKSSGGLLSRLRASGDESSSSVDEKASIEETTLEEFAAKLVKYLQLNAPQGRRARFRKMIQHELADGISLCKLELANLDRDISELGKAQAEFAEQEDEMKAKYMAVAKEFLDDLGSLQLRHTKRFQKGLAAVLDRYEEQLNAADGIGDLLESVEKIQNHSKGDLEEVIYHVSTETRKEMESLQKKYEDAMRERFAPLLESKLESERLYGGFLANIPSPVYYILDIFLTLKAGPFALLGDLILRWIATKIPIIKNITPTQLAKGFIRGQVIRNFRETTESLVVDIQAQMDESFHKAASDIEDGWETAWQDHVCSVSESFERSQRDRTDSHRSRLQACMRSLETCYEQLS